MTKRNLTELLSERIAPAGMLVLRGESEAASKEAAMKFIRDAQSFDLNLKDYLKLKVDVHMAEPTEEKRYEGLDGYEATLSILNLPIRNDLAGGVVLQAAAETFQTFPGTRALFPLVIDDVVRWQYRQDQFEKIEPLLAQSRTISGNELLSTVVNDTELTDQIAAEIAEGSRIPIKSIRTSEHSVKIWKHGMGYRTTYEFNRRVAIDLLTPYANRAMRELERSKLKRAVGLLVNGDSVFAAAPVVNQSSFDSICDANSVNGKVDYQHVLAWLVSRAQIGVPIDTVVGNWDAYFQWTKLFAVPAVAMGPTGAELLAKAGWNIPTSTVLGGPVNFAVASDCPASKLLGFTKGDTLEELVEAGSLIAESEKSIQNQTITYVRTENSGYRLIFGDTRSVFNYNA